MKLVFLKLLPKSIISLLIGLLASTPVPRPFRSFIYGLFVSMYGVKLEESLKPITEFKNFQEFFTRELKEDTRKIADCALISPVDGCCVESGLVKADRLIQAKGLSYSLSALFNDSSIASFFSQEAAQWTIYLAPGDYHRIHSPVTGEIVSRLYVPGTLYPVNNWTRMMLPNLFIENERVVTLIKSAGGYVAVIKVGALNVGSIGLSYEPTFINRPVPSALTTNYFSQKIAPHRLKHFSEPIPIKKGDQLGLFKLGSTVIVLASQVNCDWRFFDNAKIQLGEGLVN